LARRMNARVERPRVVATPRRAPMDLDLAAAGFVTAALGTQKADIFEES